jgi:ABC-type spermidine/putrescine transport system permease subunit II
MKMGTIITIILAVAALVLMSELKISFKPFSVSAPNWLNVIGWIVLSIALAILGVNENLKGYKEGYKKGSDDTIELVKQVNKEKPIETITISKEHE